MTRGLFRVGLATGETRWASGEPTSGPDALLPTGTSLAGLLQGGPAALTEAALADHGDAPPAGARILAPVEDQEVWAAGVTYERSRDARIDESREAATAYDHVYEADRPELFFKAAGWRVRGPGEEIGIRADSDWDVPEPELALVVTPGLEIAGYVIGNDVSSRRIEGDNPLYLPQAKVYDGSCALGPCIVPAGLVEPPFEIHLEVRRDGASVVAGDTSSSRLRRTPEELAAWLGRALTLPAGAILLTGTGIVPEGEFSLRARDVVLVAIDGLGVLENRVALVGQRAATSSGG